MKMKKFYWAFSILSVIFLVFSAAAAASATAENKQPKEPLDKITFIHYKDGKVKIANPGKPQAEKCYKLMGVKWKNLPVSYAINPANLQELPETFVTSGISASAETWDNATSGELFSNAYTVNYKAQYGLQNYENAVVFGDYPNDKVIAVTTVWYTRVGKQIVEFDMLLNTRFVWGDAAIDPTKMDLQNIATHELGHSIGLSDLYNACTEETMYGYSTEGETKKRDLNTGDMAGLLALYGI
jgi:hypothetical protein